MEVIVIGGGASGLVSAIASSKNNNVTIIEKNDSLAKKILVTGNGRCNYWNENINEKKYNSQNTEKIKEIINDKNLEKGLSFMNKIGIVPKIKNGYYYPYSNQAISVLNALVNEINNKNIKVEFNKEVFDIRKENNKFVVETENDKYYADKVIVATGGLAAPKTGSDGKCLEIVKKLGHKIIKPLPALVQIKTENNLVKKLSGVRSDVEVKLYEDYELIQVEEGELQHTEYGLSGICVMQLSGKINRGLDKKTNEEIRINYIPEIAKNIEEFTNWLENYPLQESNISNVLDQILNYKITNLLLKELNINNDKKINKLSTYEKELIGKNLTDFEVEVTGTNSFDNAQTTSGGISLEEINLDTMESKIIDGLFFCGEIIDIDGNCGGYNLANAWITGLIAGSDNYDNN